jgi:hypothetical protein
VQSDDMISGKSVIWLSDKDRGREGGRRGETSVCLLVRGKCFTVRLISIYNVAGSPLSLANLSKE